MSKADLGIQDECSQVISDDGLLTLLSESPYRDLLATTSWMEFPRSQELPKEWSNIVEGSWHRNPKTRLVTAVLSAGCVLYNVHSRVAVLGLVAESYGRGRDVDVHCEKPICKGVDVSGLSQPSTYGFYPQAKVCHIGSDLFDSRLVVGFRSYDVLITEVWRLQQDCSSERAFTAGCCSSAFPLGDNDTVRMFIDSRSFDLATKILSGEVIPIFDNDNLRQIRSNFTSMHSYSMGRACSFFVRNMVSAHPATVFTLCRVAPKSGNAALASSILSTIAMDVDARGRDAVLRKDEVSDIACKIRSDQLFESVVGQLVDLFGKNEEIFIIGARAPAGLETLLNSLATNLNSALYDWNKRVVVGAVTKEMSSQLKVKTDKNTTAISTLR